ncbi:SRR1-like protein isoform X1 [Megachile rotundata]|uniref:SRR1-like protein isoform X1 n=1 Tax=Megachile rotundata TaxID=143995 RepID=UPI003FD37C39
MQDNEEFKLVVRRKKRASLVRKCSDSKVPLADDGNNDSDFDIDYETLFRTILEAEVELRNSVFADDVFYRLEDSLNALRLDGVSEILCYGLGHFSRRRASKYQLALLLLLRKYYNSRVHVYDPVFYLREIQILKRFNCNVIEINEEGKRIVQDGVTLIYMPHCSIYLTNNFLYTNWSKKLSKCILLTNSFSIVTDNLIKANRSVSLDYVLRIRPYVTEIPLRNNFTYKDVFSDLNIHIFLEENINAIPQSFWNKRDEPCYQGTEIHYLTAAQTERMDLTNRCTKDET